MGRRNSFRYTNFRTECFHRSATENDINDAKKGLKEIKIQSPNKLKLGHLNIRLVRNILLISETKLNDSFPFAQFKIKGFSVPYRYDRNGKGRRLLLYMRDDIQSKLLINKSNCYIETISVVDNLRF